MQTYLSVFHRTCWKTPLWGIRTGCRCSWPSLSSRLSPKSWTSKNGWPSNSLKSYSSHAASVTVTSVRSETTALQTHTGYFKDLPTQKHNDLASQDNLTGSVKGHELSVCSNCYFPHFLFLEIALTKMFPCQGGGLSVKVILVAAIKDPIISKLLCFVAFISCLLALRSSIC